MMQILARCYRNDEHRKHQPRKNSEQSLSHRKKNNLQLQRYGNAQMQQGDKVC